MTLDEVREATKHANELIENNVLVVDIEKLIKNE